MSAGVFIDADVLLYKCGTIIRTRFIAHRDALKNTSSLARWHNTRAPSYKHTYAHSRTNTYALDTKRRACMYLLSRMLSIRDRSQEPASPTTSLSHKRHETCSLSLVSGRTFFGRSRILPNACPSKCVTMVACFHVVTHRFLCTPKNRTD